MSTNEQTLRGIGREAYRAGYMNPVVYAYTALNRTGFTMAERALVLAGWRDERSEAVAQ